MKIKNDLDLDGELKLNDYLSTETSLIDNDVDYALGVDSSGNARMIEKSTLGSAGTSSEAFFAYLDTAGGTIDTTDSVVEIDTTSLNTNTSVFNLNAGEVTMNVDMNASLSFTVGVATPSSNRITTRANLEVSTDGGSNWSEILGSRCWSYIRSGFSNDDHTIGGITVLRANTAGDKYRVVSRTMTGTVDIINYSCSLSVHALSAGEAGPTGPAGAAGATNTSLALDGSNILTLTDSESDTVTVDLSALAGGGTTPTLDDVTTAGGNTTNNIAVGNLGAQGSISSGGFQVNGGSGFVYADEEEEGFHVQDVDETDILSITGSVAGSDAQTILDGSIRFLDYAGTNTLSIVPTKLLAVNDSGDLTTNDLVNSKSVISNFETVTSSGTISCVAGTLYLIDLANVSGTPSFSLPSTGNNPGDQVWIGCNSNTSDHSNLLSVGNKLFDTGSSILTFGGSFGSPNNRMGGKDTLKWIWTGSFWYETTHAVQ